MFEEFEPSSMGSLPNFDKIYKMEERRSRPLKDICNRANKNVKRLLKTLLSHLEIFNKPLSSFESSQNRQPCDKTQSVNDESSEECAQNSPFEILRLHMLATM